VKGIIRMARRAIGFIVCFLLAFGGSGLAEVQRESESLGVAVEYTNHAAGAYIARSRGYFKKAGLNLSVYESYETGTALAAALIRGDIQVAFICLVPAINAIANAGVPLKIVAGTHKYGYGLVVNPDKIRTVADLENKGIQLGCVREGSSVDLILNRMIDRFGMNRRAVFRNLRRMNPQKQLLSARTGRLDAVFVPEHWASLAEAFGFKMLMTTQEIWPGFQGSVMVVKSDLITNRPQTVRKLVAVLREATNWAHANPVEASKILAGDLLQVGNSVTAGHMIGAHAMLSMSVDIMARSMDRLEYTTDIDPDGVQETIDYMVSQNYIKKRLKAESILDLRFNQ